MGGGAHHLGGERPAVFDSEVNISVVTFSTGETPGITPGSAPGA